MKQKEAEKRSKSLDEATGRRFGWLAIIAVLSIIGLVTWLVLSGNE